MEYYYTESENIDEANSTLEIKGFEHRHLTKVLRKTAGDDITITDGKRNIFECTIVNITKDSLVCRIKGKQENLYESDIKVRLYVSPLKNHDRFEYMIEKAVEIGVYEIQPVTVNRTVPKGSFSDSKMERMKKIIIGAMGQSQRCYLPKINNVINLEKLIKETNIFNTKYLYYEFADGNDALKRKLVASDNICILIGPEGGFEKEEINKLLDSGWQLRSLGKRKLRAETAAVVSVFENINYHK